MYDYRKMTPQERIAVVGQRQALGYPPHAPPRFLRQDAYVLFTAACYEHRPFIRDEARQQALLDALTSEFTAAGHSLLAWVILPNHYHLLVQLATPEGISRLFQLVHGRSSHQWNQEEQTRGRKVWYRFSDRTMRSEAHFYTTLNYIHYNPVKHGYVSSPYTWAVSSVHRYREHFGRDWLRDMWNLYPVRKYGDKWDEKRS